MGTQNRYDDEFKANAVELARLSDRPVSKVASDLGVSDWTLRRWIKDHAAMSDRYELSKDEREELVQLRKEVRELRIERELLKKAAAFFAKENG